MLRRKENDLTQYVIVKFDICHYTTPSDRKWGKTRSVFLSKRKKNREFLVPRGADISQSAYRPLNQRYITRTQSNSDKKKALNRVIVVRITHTP
jgi:hypothetical protein